MKGLVLVAGIGILVALAWYRYARLNRRRLGLAAFATRFGFEYSETDPFNLLWDYNLPLLEMGDRRGTENVVHGSWKGTPFIEADYWFAIQTTNSSSSQPRSHKRFNVVIVDVPAELPTLTIERETIAAWIAEEQGFHDIQFESGEFNRAFRVYCRDRAFAFKVVDARMMQWLLTTDRRFGFQLHKGAVIVYAKQLRPRDLLPLIGTAKELYDHIPRLVWVDYGTGAAEATEGGR